MNLRTTSIRLIGGIGSLIVALAMGGPAAQAGGSTIVMDTTTTATNCGSYTGQTAVTTLAAALTGVTGGIVAICPGNYPATAGVTIEGAHNLMIKQAVPGPENRPYLPVTVSASGAFYIRNSTNVTIDGLIIDGSTNTHGGYSAINYSTSSGTTRNCVVLGGATSHGIGGSTVDSTPTKVLLSNNLVSGYSIGVMVLGPMKLTMTGNTLDGTDGGRLPLTAQMGAYFSGASSVEALTGTLSKNIIMNNYYGINIEEASKVSVSGNNLLGNMFSVVVSTHGSRHNADNIKIAGNTIFNIPPGFGGIYINNADTTVPLATIHGLTISKNKISSGRFTVSGATTSGIQLEQANSTAGLITAAISANTFTGFVASPTPYYIYFASGGPVVTGTKNTHVP